MKQTVEEAAYNYLQKILESSDFEINFEEDNYDAGARDAVLDVTERAYIAGAEWRINSVWHKTKDEVPQAHGEYENDRCGNCDCPTVMKRQACEKAKNAKEYNEKPKIK